MLKNLKASTVAEQALHFTIFKDSPKEKGKNKLKKYNQYGKHRFNTTLRNGLC